MDGFYVAAGAVGAAAITGFVTYILSRRSGSGRIATSDAATLWAESQQMRRELRDQVAEHVARLDHCIEELRVERERTQTLQKHLHDSEGDVA